MGYGRADGLTDGRMDRRTDKASYRVACPQLKRKSSFCMTWSVGNAMFSESAILSMYISLRGPISEWQLIIQRGAVAKKCREIVLIKTFHTANWYFDSMDEQKPLFGDRAR